MPPSVSQKRQAITALFILMITTVLCSLPILLLGLLKLIPIPSLKLRCTRAVDTIATLWVSANNFYIDKIHPATWSVTGLENVDKKDWYLVVSNHQSWLDIVVLQRIFNRKIPVLKFFIKDGLKWVPFLGFSWWAMGCPFMKRYSKAYLAKHPHKKGKDLDATKKALHTFQQTPATLMSFIEGTRYTSQKKSAQNSPYRYLLKPKSGGIGFVINTMNQKIQHLLDVTIVYPDVKHSLWRFLCRQVDSIKVHVRLLPIPQAFLTPSLLENEETLSLFRDWLNEEWNKKDQLIHQMKQI